MSKVPAYKAEVTLTERQFRTLLNATAEKKEDVYKRIRRVSKESEAYAELNGTYRDLHAASQVLSEVLERISNPGFRRKVEL